MTVKDIVSEAEIKVERVDNGFIVQMEHRWAPAAGRKRICDSADGVMAAIETYLTEKGVFNDNADH